MKLLLIGVLSITVLLAVGVQTGGTARSSLAYHWPVKPFDRQHPIRGTFGDPRTLATDQPFGVTGPSDPGRYSFHAGVDIVAAPGTPVYPVVSGRVTKAGSDQIRVTCAGGRVFQYWHLRRNVRLGENVVAEHTVIGWIQHPADHVHLSEIDDHRGWNPLAPGHLTPYVDHTVPHALALALDHGTASDLTHGGLVRRNDELAIEAADAPAMRIPSFSGMPQIPALVEWRLYRDGFWGAWQVAADFRQNEPASRFFWHVYAPGTYQNAPVFEGQLFSGVGGEYLFRIGLEPSRLAPGRYRLEARVADVRGNSSTTTWPLVIGGS